MRNIDLPEADPPGANRRSSAARCVAPPHPLLIHGQPSVPASRIWGGFITARIIVGASILLFQGLLHLLGLGSHPFSLLLCVAYFGATLAVKILPRPRARDGLTIDRWWPTIGVDIVAFSAMQTLQAGDLNYTPLLALPVLMASILGTRTAALGTAAGVTLLLLADAGFSSALVAGGTPSRLLQAGLTGIGYFVVAFLVQPLTTRLAREEELSRLSQRAAAVQAQVNELVIDALTDGILVVNAAGDVQAVNPAGRFMMDAAFPATPTRFSLSHKPAWAPLVDLAALTFSEGAPQWVDLTLQHDGMGPSRFHARTQLTPVDRRLDASLCVMFLQDLREGEARLRTEKLAAMGRMSAAVAHEIRNPLAAIVQANQLLDEELIDPGQRQLSGMVRQNALRLVKTAEEILDVSRARKTFDVSPGATLWLDDMVGTICMDWHVNAGKGCGLQLILGCKGVVVDFDAEHLRRILVNLLDNALRYISGSDDALQVRTGAGLDGQNWIEVWSDGSLLEPTVELRLFEPFFSSESRSSGLGLYICRELCERHGAVMVYRRGSRSTGRGVISGNAFTVAFRRADAPAEIAPPSSMAFTTMPNQA